MSILGVGLALLGSFSFFALSVKGDMPVFSHLKGRFIIQTEDHGEAWYVLPESGKRLSLGSPVQAYVRLRAEAEPVSYETLARIPVGSIAQQLTHMPMINERGAAYAGKVLVQADRAPHDAWYVSPADGLRYALRSPREALSVLHHCALGISNHDIARIPAFVLPEDEHPLSLIPMGAHEATIMPRTPSADIPQETVNLIERIFEENEKDITGTRQVAVMSVRGIPVLMYPQYHQWYVFGNDIDGRDFHIENVAAPGGRYISYEKQRDGDSALHPLQLAEGVDAFLYGLYIFNDTHDAEDDHGVSFFVQDSKGSAIVTLKILLTEKRFPAIIGDIQEHYRGANMLDGYGFFYDDTNAYLMQYDSLWRLDGVDMPSLKTWTTRDDEPVIGDQYGLFGVDAFGQPYRMIDEDPERSWLISATVDSLSGRTRTSNEWNDDGYQYIADGRIVKKDGRTYVGAVGYDRPFVLEHTDTDSLTLWPDEDGRFFTDLKNIYYRGDTAFNALPMISAKSFSIIARTDDEYFIKDESGVYRMPRAGVFNATSGVLEMKRITGVDAESLDVLYSDSHTLIAKDSKHVYAGAQFMPVKDADAASFHLVFTVEGIPFGRDQYSIFYALPKKPDTLYRLSGADPRTFQLKALPTIEPALEGLMYPGSDMLVYAHDDTWMWLYDNAHDGLTIIKRANREEKIMQENVLTFARMYAGLFP